MEPAALARGGPSGLGAGAEGQQAVIRSWGAVGEPRRGLGPFSLAHGISAWD